MHTHTGEAISTVPVVAGAGEATLSVSAGGVRITAMDTQTTLINIYNEDRLWWGLGSLAYRVDKGCSSINFDPCR